MTDNYNPIGRELAPAIAAAGVLKPSLADVDGARLVFDTRGLGTRPDVEALVATVLAANVVASGATLVAGIANSGSVWAALAGRAAGLPHCNVLVDGRRSKGLGRHIEPDDIQGHRVALIDNWFSSGRSVATARQIITAHGATPAAAVVISAATDIRNFEDLEVRVLWPRDLLLASLPAAQATAPLSSTTNN